MSSCPCPVSQSSKCLSAPLLEPGLPFTQPCYACWKRVPYLEVILLLTTRRKQTPHHYLPPIYSPLLFRTSASHIYPWRTYYRSLLHAPTTTCTCQLIYVARATPVFARLPSNTEVEVGKPCFSCKACQWYSESSGLNTSVRGGTREDARV